MSSAILDPEDIGKLFVGGLSPSTTKDSLQDYFSQFGEVVDSVVMKNNETGRSRGFGFITFKDPNCMFKALQIKVHELDGKKIDPKECTPRSMQKTRKQASKCKVFLGGLPPDITEEAIRSGMSKFGKVDQVVIMFDQETRKCRGFGFLSFELEESIDQVCAERFVIINGKQVECKKAEPRVSPKQITQSYDLTKNQNGFIVQPAYSQMTPVPQNNWNAHNQALYALQGSSFPSYASYNNSGLSLNTTPPGYTAVQSLPYMQPYQSNFASNNYAQSPSSYGPTKAYIGGTVSDATYMNQGGHSSNYQRYHPYKA